jgi:hypothetical protein
MIGLLVSILRLARRTRQLPEIYIGVGLFGYVVAQLASLAVAAPGAEGNLALVFVWMGIEALLYHRKARRACEIGLVSADVVNRFLVWGLGAMASGILLFAPPAAYRRFVESRAPERATSSG